MEECSDAPVAKVLRIAPPDECGPVAVNEQAAEILEDLLARVRSGEVSGPLAIVYANADGTYGSQFTGCEDVAKRLGMLELARHRLFERHAGRGE